MNNIISKTFLAGALLSLSFVSCVNEEDAVFDKSAGERLNEASSIYTKRLSSSEHGWVMEYYVTNSDEAPKGLGYLMLVDFDKNGSVRVGMNNVLSYNNYRESTSAWDVITDNGPVLSFSTYNTCIHAFSSPEKNSSLGLDKGKGMEGDYEFVITDCPENAQHVTIKGKKRDMYSRLTRLEQETNFAEYLADLTMKQRSIFGQSVPNYILMNIGGEKMKIDNITTNLASIYPFDGDPILNSFKNPYLIVKYNGSYYLRFRDAIEGGNGEFAQEFRYDDETNVFYDVANSANIIYGPTDDCALDIFYSSIVNGERWKVNDQEAAGSMKEAIEAVKTGLKAYNSRYAFTSMSFSMNTTTKQIVFDLKYKYGSANRTASYTYNIDYDGSKIVLDYVSESGNKIMDNVPAVADFVHKLENGITAVAASTGSFNLTTMHMSAGEDANSWVTISIEGKL